MAHTCMLVLYRARGLQVSVMLPEGDVYYRPDSAYSHGGVTHLDPSPPLHGSISTTSGSGISSGAGGEAPGPASSGPAAPVPHRERQLNVLNTDDRTVRHAGLNGLQKRCGPVLHSQPC